MRQHVVFMPIESDESLRVAEAGHFLFTRTFLKSSDG
jgi:hypothetical protein